MILVLTIWYLFGSRQAVILLAIPGPVLSGIVRDLSWDGGALTVRTGHSSSESRKIKLNRCGGLISDEPYQVFRINSGTFWLMTSADTYPLMATGFPITRIQAHVAGLINSTSFGRFKARQEL